MGNFSLRVREDIYVESQPVRAGGKRWLGVATLDGSTYDVRTVVSIDESPSATPPRKNMPLAQNEVNAKCFNRSAKLPFGLRLKDFEMAMQDVYDFLYDVNLGLIERGLQRLDDMLRPAIMSGVLSDMLTASLANHSRSLTVNLYHNGHPDLVVNGIYPDNKVKAGSEGVEIKATWKAGGAVDTHGARDQWMCVFVYDVDNSTEPANDRAPMTVTEIYLGHVTKDDFRKNQRGELGTRTATLHKSGIEKLRKSWVYKLNK